jgi:uncharacterized GH25 family protein/ketosteroid isomerase-like protein
MHCGPAVRRYSLARKVCREASLLRQQLRRRVSLRASTTCVILVALATTATVVGAHDFWLVPNAFRLAEGSPLEVRGQTSSSFPTSEAAVAVERVADARVLGATGSIAVTDLSVSGTSLMLRLRPSGAGQRVIAVTLHPRSVRESAAGFRRYLELEGAPDALERVDREGLLAGRDSVMRRYTKYAKTLVEVGRGGPRAYAHAAGHPLEFLPEADPAALGQGDTLSVRLLFRGSPLANAAVHAGFVATPQGRVLLSAPSPEPDLHVRTDAQGRVRVPLRAAGLWNVRTLHVTEADRGSGADWDTHWATLVFHIGDQRPGAAPPQSAAVGDSAAIVATVDRYHLALATGDSAAALALLTDDAVILESGGIETRAEYRSHHLPSDIEFARAVPSVRGPVRVTVRGDVAWAASTSTTQGEFRGRAVNSVNAELMVLVRTPDGWKISAIHWSSRARRQ